MTNINKIILRFIITALLISPFLLFGQEEKKWYNGFGIEAGVGYNTVTWHDDWGPNNSYIMGAFWIQPAGRIYYSVPLLGFSEIKKIKIPVFIGYYSFGAMAKDYSFIPEDHIYKDILLFRSIEAGINPCIESNKIQFGLLFKGQYIFSEKESIYISYNFAPPGWKEIDISMDYKIFAMNTGIKLKYKIIKGLSIAGEAWFGITNLYAHTTYGSNGKLKVYENNYRLVIGYEL